MEKSFAFLGFFERGDNKNEVTAEKKNFHEENRQFGSFLHTSFCMRTMNATGVFFSMILSYC